MNSFNDFQNYEELLRSMQYKDIAQFCRTNSTFREVCNSSWGKRIIRELLEQSIDDVINSDTSIPSILHVQMMKNEYAGPSRLGNNEKIRQLMDEYSDLITDSVAQFLMKMKNPVVIQSLLWYITTVYGEGKNINVINQTETRYTPIVNNLITRLYQLKYGDPGYLLVNIIKNTSPHVYENVDYNEFEKEAIRVFLRRHPELLQY